MFNNNYIIYRPKSGDSFAHLAYKFNLSEEDLITFHNQNCNNNSRIYFKDISGLNEIYIPINYKTPKEIEKLLLSERPNSVLDSDFYKEKYKIQEIVTNDNESIELDYDLSLVFDRIDNENVVTIHRDQLNKKGKQLSNKMQELALWSSQSLFPISFLVDEKNTPIKIKDYDSLKNAFQLNRTKIEDFYKGNFVENYLDLFYDQLSNEQKICQKIISSALFKSLFPDVKWFRKTDSFFYFVSYFTKT